MNTIVIYLSRKRCLSPTDSGRRLRDTSGRKTGFFSYTFRFLFLPPLPKLIGISFGSENQRVRESEKPSHPTQWKDCFSLSSCLSYRKPRPHGDRRRRNLPNIRISRSTILQRAARLHNCIWIRLDFCLLVSWRKFCSFISTEILISSRRNSPTMIGGLVSKVKFCILILVTKVWSKGMEFSMFCPSTETLLSSSLKSCNESCKKWWIGDGTCTPMKQHIDSNQPKHKSNTCQPR